MKSGDIYLKSIDKSHRRQYEKFLANDDSERNHDTERTIQELYVGMIRRQCELIFVFLFFFVLERLLSKPTNEQRSQSLVINAGIFTSVLLLF